MATYPRSQKVNSPNQAIGQKARTSTQGPVIQANANRFSYKPVETAADVIENMSRVQQKLEDGLIAPSIGNAICNCQKISLKIVEMQFKYGLSGRSRLLLVDANDQKQKLPKEELSSEVESEEDEHQAEE